MGQTMGKFRGPGKPAAPAVKSVGHRSPQSTTYGGESATEIRKEDRDMARKKAKEYVKSVKRVTRTTAASAAAEGKAPAPGGGAEGRQQRQKAAPRKAAPGTARQKAKEGREEQQRTQNGQGRRRERGRVQTRGSGRRDKLERAKKRAGTRSKTPRKGGPATRQKQ